jgi:hypothetical protein
MTLSRRRWQACSALLTGIGASGAGAAVPHFIPGVGVVKHTAIATADLVMLGAIYTVYFGERPEDEQLWVMLVKANALVVVGGVLTYGTIKIMDWAVDELLQFVPIVGQVASGVISGSVSATLGAFWWWGCDYAYRNGVTVPEALRGVAHA